MEKIKTTNDKIDINDFGIKTLTNDKGEETEYMVYSLANDNESIQDRYNKKLKNTDPNRNYYFSLSYKNKEDQYETEPFADRSIGFIISGNYNIKASYVKNAKSKMRKKEEQKNYGNNEKLFLQTMQECDEKYKEISKNIDNIYKKYPNEIRTQEDLEKIQQNIKKVIYNKDKQECDEKYKEISKNIDNIYKEHPNEIQTKEDLEKIQQNIRKVIYNKDKQECDEKYKEISKNIDNIYKKYPNEIRTQEDLEKIQQNIKKVIYNKDKIRYIINESDVDIGFDDYRIKLNKDYYDLEFEGKTSDEIRDQVLNLCNEIRENNTQLRIENNELVCKKRNGQCFDIKSLFINLTDRNSNEKTLFSTRNNSRNSQLKRIAENMNDIVSFQMEKFGHIQIPYRDAKDKKVNFPYLYEFIDTIKDLCEEHNIKLPKNYPSSSEIRGKCIQCLEKKFQILIKEILKKDKKCNFFNIKNNTKTEQYKLLNNRREYFQYHYLIKKINTLYEKIINSSMDENHLTPEKKEEYYIRNLNTLYYMIKENYKSITYENEEQKVNNLFSEENCLKTINKYKTDKLLRF